MELSSLADLWGIAEGNCKEQGGNRQSENEDVSEAFHRDSPGNRSVEGASCGRNVTLGQTTGGFVAEFLEQAELNLIAQVRIDTGKHVAVQRSGSVPDVAEEEQQREGCMAEGEPAAG